MLETIVLFQTSISYMGVLFICFPHFYRLHVVFTFISFIFIHRIYDILPRMCHVGRDIYGLAIDPIGCCEKDGGYPALYRQIIAKVGERASMTLDWLITKVFLALIGIAPSMVLVFPSNR